MKAKDNAVEIGQSKNFGNFFWASSGHVINAATSGRCTMDFLVPTALPLGGSNGVNRPLLE